MSSEVLLTISLIGPVFIGMLVGGIIGKIGYSVMKQKLSLLYITSGGLLIGFICFELIPESIKEYNYIGILLGFSLGMIGMLILDKALHHYGNKKIKENSMQSIIFLLVAISLHNIPTGFAIGSSLTSESSFSSSLIVGMILHHVPEGIALFISVVISNLNFLSFMFMALLLSIILGGSILLGQGFSLHSHKASTMVMGGAIGTFSFIALFEILLRGYKKVSMVEFVTFLALGLGIIQMYLISLG